MANSKTQKIRALNDLTRSTFTGAQIMMTAGVHRLDDQIKARVLSAFREFNKFDKGNDPHHEHDFVSVEVDGLKVFAKCDYYDPDLQFHSDDPSDPTITKRVWTIMLAEEY